MYRDVFELKVYADSSVPKHGLEHTFNLLSRYLDADEDGGVECAKVLKVLSKEMEE